MFNLIKFFRNLYARFERPISSLSLVGGFVFDAITLTRVDEFWENFWIGAHLLIVAICIILLNKSHSENDENNPSKSSFWYVNILQFFFGGLLSAYLVFYFRAADLGTSWPFLFILATAFWANESLKRKFARLSFQIGMFYLSLFAFLIYHIPTTLHKIGQTIFLISGGMSLIIIFIFLIFLRLLIGNKYLKHRKILYGLIFSLYLFFNFLYFANLIPPLPISLKDGGIYHSIFKTTEGTYKATAENSNWQEYITLYPEIHVMKGETVFAYSAIFSPENLDLNVSHTWQKYDSSLAKWVTESNVVLPLLGGRSNGYRTYSSYNNLSEGKWRVIVKTSDGLSIGKIRFSIVLTNQQIKISTTTLD